MSELCDLIHYLGQHEKLSKLASVYRNTLVNKYEHLAFALNEEELLIKIEDQIRAAGGTIIRGPRA